MSLDLSNNLDMSAVTFTRPLIWSQDVQDALIQHDDEYEDGGLHFGLGVRGETEREFVVYRIEPWEGANEIRIVEVRTDDETGKVTLAAADYGDIFRMFVRKLVGDIKGGAA